MVGVQTIADFIDPAQIDERRQTIDAMRTALEPVDADTAAEVPWTAREGRPAAPVRRPGPGPARPSPDIGFDERPAEADAVDDKAVRSSNGRMAHDDGPLEANGGYVVVAIDVTEREELAADRERLFAIQKEVTQSLIEQNNRLRERPR